LLLGTNLIGQKSPAKAESGFGFNIGFVYGHTKLETSLNSASDERLWVQDQGGFTMGIAYQRQLDQRISIRPALNLTLIDNYIVYENDDGSNLRKDIFPAFIELPIHFKFTNKAPTNNISVLFGVKITKSLDAKLDQEFILRDSFTSAEFGLGKEFDLARFTIAPEIMYSFGLENLYRYSILPEFAENVEQLVLNQLVVRVLFY
jgi:hypothetical protein